MIYKKTHKTKTKTNTQKKNQKTLTSSIGMLLCNLSPVNLTHGSILIPSFPTYSVLYFYCALTTVAIASSEAGHIDLAD